MPDHRIPADLNVINLIEDAKKEFYKDPNVIGVGVGERRKSGTTHRGQVTLVAYVKTKLRPEDVNPDYPIPPDFQGIPTDVVEPFGPESRKTALGFTEEAHHLDSDDKAFVDWPRLHQQWMAEEGGDVAFHGQVQDFGNVSVIEDDGTLVRTVNGQKVVDFVRAYQLFRTTHPDIYDFVTFFTDTANGMPPQGGSSWYQFVFNDADGIGLGHFDYRGGYGSDVLQGIMFLNQGHFNSWRYVMLQEQAHRWSAFARYKDSEAGAIQNDHMLNGWAHWAVNFDDDKSPMDYDVYDWVEDGDRFKRISLDDDERTYCNLDLYLMGLLDKQEVGNFYLLSNVSRVSGNSYSADKKPLDVHDIIRAEGERTPSAADSQRIFKNAFVVLTGNIENAHDLVDMVDGLRRRFENDYFQATKTLGRIDTSLVPPSGRLTGSQVQQLTSEGYTTLHRHISGFNDLRVTGLKFIGSLNPGYSQRWYTHGWQREWVVKWSLHPTTLGGKISWSEEIELAHDGKLTYWITVRNTGSVTTNFEARYAAFHPGG